MNRPYVSRRRGMGGSVALLFALWGFGMIADVHAGSDRIAFQEMEQITLQIAGRYCEYVRADVETALRRYEAVQRVEFLNDHGTVLVQVIRGQVAPGELADAAAAASFGLGCRAWVDRGGTASQISAGVLPGSLSQQE